MIKLANLLCVLSAYLIESWISPGCSYEFNVVYVQHKQEVHIFKNKNNRKSWRDIFVYHFLFLYLFIRSCKIAIIETHAYDIAHDANAISSLIIQSTYQGQVESSRRCSITKAVLKIFAIFTGKYLCRSLFLT